MKTNPKKSIRNIHSHSTCDGGQTMSEELRDGHQNHREKVFSWGALRLRMRA